MKCLANGLKSTTYLINDSLSYRWACNIGAMQTSAIVVTATAFALLLYTFCGRGVVPTPMSTELIYIAAFAQFTPMSDRALSSLVHPRTRMMFNHCASRAPSGGNSADSDDVERRRCLCARKSRFTGEDIGHARTTTTTTTNFAMSIGGIPSQTHTHTATQRHGTRYVHKH